MRDFIGLTCAFTGYRSTKLPWGYNEADPRAHLLKLRISDLLVNLYRGGFRHFLFGGALGADQICAGLTLQMRGKTTPTGEPAYPGVTLTAVLPCANQDERWSTEQKAQYAGLLSECDDVITLHETYTSGCMMRRNRYLVDNSDALVAIFDGRTGGTYNTVKYAKGKKLNVIVIKP